MTLEQQKFYALLAELAKICGVELTPVRIQIYDDYLADLGWPKVNRAITTVIIERRHRDPMPSPKELKLLANPELSSDDQGLEAAGRIMQAVSKFGSHRTLDARSWLGEVCWETVQLYGGWETLCQFEIREKTSVMAQLRDLSKVVAKKKVLGIGQTIDLRIEDKTQKQSGLIDMSKLLGSIHR